MVRKPVLLRFRIFSLRLRSAWKGMSQNSDTNKSEHRSDLTKADSRDATVSRGPTVFDIRYHFRPRKRAKLQCGWQLYNTWKIRSLKRRIQTRDTICACRKETCCIRGVVCLNMWFSKMLLPVKVPFLRQTRRLLSHIFVPRDEKCKLFSESREAIYVGCLTGRHVILPTNRLQIYYIKGPFFHS